MNYKIRDMSLRTISQIVFDLETIPGKEKPTPKDVKVPANYTKEETIEKYRNDPKRLAEMWKAQALSYILGRIHSIGFKIGTDPVGVVFDHEDEEATLKAFDKACKDAFEDHYGSSTLYGVTWVGHNIKTFDLPFLWLRARKYDCKTLLHLLGEDPNDIKYQDTMQWGCVTDKYKGFVSLDKLCEFFGLPGKGGMDGSQVYDYWVAGKDQEIADYCVDDTQKTHDVAEKLGIIIPE